MIFIRRKRILDLFENMEWGTVCIIQEEEGISFSVMSYTFQLLLFILEFISILFLSIVLSSFFAVTKTI